MPSHRSRAHAGDPADRASAPTKLHGDKGVTTTRAAARRCERVGSHRGSPAAASSRASGSAATGMWWSGRSLAWLVGYRRLQVRYERRTDILLGFVHLACALICLTH
jgi:hypothetical protein